MGQTQKLLSSQDCAKEKNIEVIEVFSSVHSVLVTRTALFEHQLHNLINQSFPSPFVLNVHFCFLYKSRMLSGQVQTIMPQASL